MSSVIHTSLVAAAIALAVTPAVRHVAVRVGLFDRALTSRKVHGRHIPRLGGIGIVAGAYGALLLAVLAMPSVRGAVLAAGRPMLGLAAAGLAVAALGLFDDLRGADARKKLTVQFGAGLLLYAMGFRLDVLDNPLGREIALGAWSLPLTLLWIAGASNAMNLVDGLDGLAGGLALAALVVVFALGARADDAATMAVACALAGGVLGFLVYNVNPASIFMGDTGSLFLGATIGALALRPHSPGSGHLPFASVLLGLGIPIADTAIALVRRATRGTPLFHADREHIHHRLLHLGLSHRQAVLVLWAGSALLAAAAVQLADGARRHAFLLVSVFVAVAAVLNRLGVLGMPSRALLERRKRNRERLQTVRVVSARLREAVELDDVQSELVQAAPALGAKTVWLQVPASDEPSVPAPTRGMLRLRSRFYLDASHPERGAIEVVWRRRPARPDRDAEIALELLCPYVAVAVERISPADADRELETLRPSGRRQLPAA